MIIYRYQTDAIISDDGNDFRLMVQMIIYIYQTDDNDIRLLVQMSGWVYRYQLMTDDILKIY